MAYCSRSFKETKTNYMDQKSTQSQQLKFKDLKEKNDGIMNGEEPGDNIISNILNYSKALSIRKTQSGAILEMVLN
jgi:hypothetical protein